MYPNDFTQKAALLQSNKMGKSDNFVNHHWRWAKLI